MHGPWAMPWKQTIKMLRYFTLLFIFGCVSKVLCLQSSCSAEPPGPERAAGCGCDKLTRDAPTVDPLDEDEGKAASTDPDLKYSKDANDRTNQVQDNERETQSPVCCDSCYRKKKKKNTAILWECGDKVMRAKCHKVVTKVESDRSWNY